MPVPWSRSTDDIDDVFAPTPDWEFELIQMGCGALGYRSAVVPLPGLTLMWEKSRRDIRSKEKKLHPGFSIATAFSWSRPPRWKGQATKPAQFLIFGADDHDMILPAGGVWLTFDVSAELALKTGLAHFLAGIWAAKPGRYDVLMRRCVEIARRWRGGLDAHAPQKAGLKRVAESLALCLMASLDAPADVESHPHFKIVRDAEALIEANGWANPLATGDVSEGLGLPRRTMHRAFKTILGMGPRSYARLVQLHIFHQALKDRDDIQGVTEAALDAGFEHLGRAALYYRRHFARLPSATRRIGAHDRALKPSDPSVA